MATKRSHGLFDEATQKIVLVQGGVREPCRIPVPGDVDGNDVVRQRDFAHLLKDHGELQCVAVDIDHDMLMVRTPQGEEELLKYWSQLVVPSTGTAGGSAAPVIVVRSRAEAFGGTAVGVGEGARVLPRRRSPPPAGGEEHAVVAPVRQMSCASSTMLTARHANGLGMGTMDAPAPAPIPSFPQNFTSVVVTDVETVTTSDKEATEQQRHETITRALTNGPAGTIGYAGSAALPNITILLVRHGQSVGNVDKAMFKEVPDHAMPLTDLGHEMAHKAGVFLKRFFERRHHSKQHLGHHVRLWTSPMQRARQTAEKVLRAVNEGPNKWIDSVRESVFLAEQDWGTFEGSGADDEEILEKYKHEYERSKRMAHHMGKFWARFPNGESCFDVCNRMAGIFSDIQSGITMTPPGRPPIRTVIIVSHGVTIRAFLSMWFRYSPEWFAKSMNPPNCSIQLIEDHRDSGYIFCGYGKDGTDDVCPERDGDPRMEFWEKCVNEV